MFNGYDLSTPFYVEYSNMNSITCGKVKWFFITLPATSKQTDTNWTEKYSHVNIRKLNEAYIWHIHSKPKQHSM